MQFLSIADPNIWLLALTAVLVVFAILVIIVAILGIFTAVAKKTTKKVIDVKSNIKENKQAKTFEKASEEDKAAVAVALHLYFTEKENRESRVLTIKSNPYSAWNFQLNPRL
ncbi:MAG: OadG family protein [Bacteroidaceae bacterium]|nr:OadG family protein [Bacteroidaceae bacterium]